LEIDPLAGVAETIVYYRGIYISPLIDLSVTNSDVVNIIGCG
jgi:hypothetical protein